MVINKVLNSNSKGFVFIIALTDDVLFSLQKKGKCGEENFTSLLSESEFSEFKNEQNFGNSIILKILIQTKSTVAYFVATEAAFAAFANASSEIVIGWAGAGTPVALVTTV